jgi:hypothetical protein
MKRFALITGLLAVAAAGWAYWHQGRPATAPDGGVAAAAGLVATAPVPVPEVPVAAVSRGLHFEKILLDVPVAADALTTVADFGFSNSTDRPITIDRVEKTCSCLDVKVSGGKLTYAPGEQGVIRATFELGNLTGEVEKIVLLFLAGDPEDKPSHTLTVRVRIPVLVNLSQKTLQWEVGGKPEPQKIDIEMTHSKPIRILSTQCSVEGFKLDLKVIEEGRRYELWVTPAATTEPGLGLIRLETDCEIPRHKIHQAFAAIRAKLPSDGGAATP